MAGIKTLVVVLNYRGEAVLLPCVDSLVSQMEPEDRLLVIDQGSEDRLMGVLKQTHPQIEVVVSPKNGGFAYGMNQGLRLAIARGFDAVWIVNNDVVALEGALSKLKQAAATFGEKSIFSPAITTSDGKVWFAGGEIEWLRMRVRHWQQLNSREPYLSNFLTGCALFIPVSVLKQIGLLNERFFLYYEDAEYSKRIQEVGGKLWVVPQARIVHREESQHSTDKVYWLVRSGVYFFLTQAGGWRKPIIRAVFILRRAKNWLDRTFSPNPVAEKVNRAYTDALRDLHD